MIYKDIEERDNKIAEILELNEEYNSQVRKRTELWHKMKAQLGDTEHWKSIFEFDNASGALGVIEMDVAYEKGFKDGIRLIFESIRSDSTEVIKSFIQHGT